MVLWALLVVAWFEKLSYEILQKDESYAESDITTLRVAGENPLVRGHSRHLCHIQNFPFRSPGKAIP